MGQSLKAFLTIPTLGIVHPDKKPAKTTPPPVPVLPPTPKLEDAESTAQAEQDARRRTLLETGGQTQYTGPGGAPLLQGQTQSPTLLGG